jgi:hypothetical protein
MTPRLHISIGYYPNPDSTSSRTTSYNLPVEPDAASILTLYDVLDRATRAWSTDLSLSYHREDDAADLFRKEPF